MSGKALFKYENVLTSLSKHPQSDARFFSHRQTGKNRLSLGGGEGEKGGAQNFATEPEGGSTIELQFICCNEAIYNAELIMLQYFLMSSTQFDATKCC